MKRRTISFGIGQDLERHLDYRAKRSAISKSAIIREALQDYLGKSKENDVKETGELDGRKWTE